MGRCIDHKVAAAEHSPSAWMPYSPHKQDPVEGELHSFVLEQVHARVCPRQINSNLWGKQSIFLVMIHTLGAFGLGSGDSLKSEVVGEEFSV
jgi:hypothetical protein